LFPNIYNIILYNDITRNFNYDVLRLSKELAILLIEYNSNRFK